MPSKAKTAFDENAKDISRLLDLHKEKGGDAPGRRHGLEVLNKSAIVLITAIWEAYCEDIASEALEHLITYAATADVLSKEIKKQIATELKKPDANHLAVWGLADDGWKRILKGRLDDLQLKRDRRLNTPKTSEIDELFLSAIGLENVSTAWTWPYMSVDRARRKLDGFVNLRGAIAHRGKAATKVHKSQVEDYFEHVKKLVGRTGSRIATFVKRATGQPLWSSSRDRE